MVKKTFKDQENGKLPDRPPVHLGKIASSMWRKLVPVLNDNDSVKRIDANLIELYCSQYEIYRKAYESIHDKGIQQEITKPIQNAAGKILGEKSMGFKRNPATSVYNDAIKQLTTIGMQLGLSPKSRADLLESADDEIDLKAGMSEFM